MLTVRSLKALAYSDVALIAYLHILVHGFSGKSLHTQCMVIQPEEARARPESNGPITVYLHASVKGEASQNDGSPGLRPICIYLLQPLVYLQPSCVCLHIVHCWVQVRSELLRHLPVLSLPPQTACISTEYKCIKDFKNPEL